MLRGRDPAPWAALLAALVLIPGLADPPLLAPWETTHAGIAGRLAADGPAAAYTPTRLGGKVLDRPAPGYWPAAMAERVLGPSRLPARLPAAMAGIALVFAVFVLVRRARGAPAAGFAAALVLGTPLLALLFRSALPAAVVTALAASGFLCAAASLAGPTRSYRLEIGAALLLASAAGFGGLPAVAPPLAALALFGLLEPRPGEAPPPPPRLRRWVPPIAGVVLAGALIGPAFALHGSDAAWGYLRPDIAEEVPKTEAQLAKTDRPDDRNAHDREVEAVLVGAFPWILLLPGALFAPLFRRRRDASCTDATTAAAATANGGEGFDLLCLLWGGSSVAAALILGDRWHHDPFAALAPLAVCTGLYIDRKRTEGWTAADAGLVLLGLVALAVAYRDLRGGGRLLDALRYFPPEASRSVEGIGGPLGLAALGAAAIGFGTLVMRRLPCALGVTLAAVSLAWTVTVAHLLPPRPEPVPAPNAAEVVDQAVSTSRTSQNARPTETQKPMASAILRLRVTRERGNADCASAVSASATIRSIAAWACAPRTGSSRKARYRAAARSSFCSLWQACRNSSCSPGVSHFAATASHSGASDSGSSSEAA